MRPMLRRCVWAVATVAYGASVVTIAWLAWSLTEQNARYTKIIEASRLAATPDIEGDQWLTDAWCAELPRATSPSGRSKTLSSSSGRPVLLVFVADDCESCATAARRWSSAVRVGDNPPFDYFVAYLGRVPEDSGYGQQPTLLRIRDAEAVRYRLGVRSVPLAILFDQDRRIRATVVGAPSEETVARCVRVLRAYPDGPEFFIEYEPGSHPFLPAAPHATASLTR